MYPFVDASIHDSFVLVKTFAAKPALCAFCAEFFVQLTQSVGYNHTKRPLQDAEVSDESKIIGERIFHTAEDVAFHLGACRRTIPPFKRSKDALVLCL